MSQKIPFRIAFLSLALAFSPLTLHSQAPADPMGSPASNPSPGMGPQRQTPNPAMQDSSGSIGINAETMKDKMFLRKAAAGGMAEVQLGQLAAQKAQSPDVKAFGEKMVTDHTALNEQMKPIADSMGVMMPKKLKKEDQAEYDKLNGLSGSDFDTEYVTFMVKDHHDDLREFRQESQNATDPALKDAVTRGARIIREHASMIDKIAKDMNLPVTSEKAKNNPAP